MISKQLPGPWLAYLVVLTTVLPIAAGIITGVALLPIGIGYAIGPAFVCFLFAPLTLIPGAILGVIGTFLYWRQRRAMVMIWGSLVLGVIGWWLAGYTLGRAMGGSSS